jgi:hypothetical protein
MPKMTPVQSTTMINRISGAIMIAGAAAILIGLPLFATIRDSKALRSSAPICHSSETLSECLAPLPPVPVAEVTTTAA